MFSRIPKDEITNCIVIASRSWRVVVFASSADVTVSLFPSFFISQFGVVAGLACSNHSWMDHYCDILIEERFPIDHILVDILYACSTICEFCFMSGCIPMSNHQVSLSSVPGRSILTGNIWICMCFDFRIFQHVSGLGHFEVVNNLPILIVSGGLEWSCV